MQDNVVIVAASRTPMGSFQGVLAPHTASQLGASAIRSSLARTDIAGEDVDEVIMGNVLSAGQGQAPARQASLGAGLPLSAGCTTINKMCGSGMKATMLAHDLILSGSGDIILCGGMESMSNAPYLLPKVRDGLRLGHGSVQDHLFIDGLEDAYDKGKLMGTFAETCAEKYSFSREQQDDFAIRSLKRAQAAIREGKFAAEICSVKVQNRKQTTEVCEDESPFRSDMDKIPHLRPAFRADGTITAANSSSISDGAAAMVLMRESIAIQRGLVPKARILAHATHAQAPEWFTTAPAGAIQKCLDKLDYTVADIDLFEINEAFAVVTMAAIEELSLDIEKVNIHGGACALGHPIGASGARILVTLLAALEQYNLNTGLGALCIGGGEATAMVIQRISN